MRPRASSAAMRPSSTIRPRWPTKPRSTATTLAIAVAYLHDTLEKSSVTTDELERAFGGEIRDLVVDLSEDPDIADDDANRLDRRRRALEGSERTRLIFACDRLDGIRHLTEMIDEGADPTDLEVDRRVSSWRDDIEQLGRNGPAERPHVRPRAGDDRPRFPPFLTFSVRKRSLFVSPSPWLRLRSTRSG